jgi:hypothetical protein
MQSAMRAAADAKPIRCKDGVTVIRNGSRKIAHLLRLPPQANRITPRAAVKDVSSGRSQRTLCSDMVMPTI